MRPACLTPGHNLVYGKMPEHTGRQPLPKCLEHNLCSEAATVHLFKASLFL